MKIIAEPIRGGDLKAGDLFSTVGPEYWDRAEFPGAGERVYIRTTTPAAPGQEREMVYRIRIEMQTTITTHTDE